MKKIENTTIYCNNCQEINDYFLALSYNTFKSKSDIMTLCSQATFLFQEKLPIIYANIRV